VNAYAGPAAPTRTCTLLTQRAGTVPLAKGTTAVMPNADGAGYYRFALAGEDLDRLIALVPTLPEAEAIMLADSVAAAFRAGRLPFDQFLVAAQRLATHPSRLASISLGWELIDIKDRWADPATRGAIATHLRELYSPRLAELGLDVRRGVYADESAERRQMRRSLASLVVNHGRDPVLRAKLAEAARASLTDPRHWTGSSVRWHGGSACRSSANPSHNRSRPCCWRRRTASCARTPRPASERPKTRAARRGRSAWSGTRRCGRWSCSHCWAASSVRP